MKITLPSAWGPATILTVAIVLIIAIGGMVQVLMDDLSWDGYMDLLASPGVAVLVGGLAIGRGVAWGGQGTGLAAKSETTTEVMPASGQNVPR
jgi:hypothetical protein